MPFNSPDIETFKVDLGNTIESVLKLKADSHATIKIQSLLNITIYVLATRFLEGSVKHIVYNCCTMRGDTQAQLSTLASDLKRFNNPEFTPIKDLFMNHLNFDITQGIASGNFTAVHISLLNEIVHNRHRNVHATNDSAEWYNKNTKDITTNFQTEYSGLLAILTYLDRLTYNAASATFVV